MTDIIQMSKGGTKFYPQTHAQAVLGLPDLSSFQNDSDVQTAITNALSDFKTQINDSIAGTNLLLKTDVPFSITGNNTASQFQQMYALSRRLEAGTKIIVSYDAVSTASANFTFQINGSNGGAKVGTISGTVDTTNLHYIATITPDGLSDLSINMLLDNVPSTTTITISNMTLQLKTAISSALSDVNAKVKDLETKIDKLSQGK